MFPMIQGKLDGSSTKVLRRRLDQEAVFTGRDLEQIPSSTPLPASTLAVLQFTLNAEISDYVKTKNVTTQLKSEQNIKFLQWLSGPYEMYPSTPLPQPPLPPYIIPFLCPRPLDCLKTSQAPGIFPLPIMLLSRYPYGLNSHLLQIFTPMSPSQ